MQVDNYYKINQGDRSLVITKDPMSWFLCDAKKTDSIEQSLAKENSELNKLIHQNAKMSRKPQNKHLAMYPVIKLTNRCNLNCSHCYIQAHDSMKKGKCDLEFRDVRRFIDYIINLGDELGEPTLTLQLFGGEPTLHNDFLEIVEYIRSKGIYVKVSTNAANVKHFQSGSFDKYFDDKNVEWRVSLESHIPEAHNKIRPNSYHKVVDNLAYMAERKANISIKTIVSHHNFSHFEDTIYFSKEIGATNYLYSPMSLTGAALKNSLTSGITSLMINKKVIKLIERDPIMGKFFRPSPLARYLKLIYTKDSSVLPRVQFFLNHDGKICPQDNLYENPEFHFGNVQNSDFRFEKVKHYQKILESELKPCKNCPIEGYCPKGDYADIVANNRELTEEFSICSDIREVIYYLMSIKQRGIRILESIYG